MFLTAIFPRDIKLNQSNGSVIQHKKRHYWQVQVLVLSPIRSPNSPKRLILILGLTESLTRFNIQHSSPKIKMNSESRHGQFIFDWENERNVLTRHSAQPAPDAGRRKWGKWSRDLSCVATLSPPGPRPPTPHTCWTQGTSHHPGTRKCSWTLEE